MRILVTSGATREPIDDVRFLSNVSTGGTGAALADAFASSGHTVALLRGEGSSVAVGEVETEVFGSAGDLEARLRRRLATSLWDVVVMAAAVADYRPDIVAEGKLDSWAGELNVRLLRNPKLLPQLKSWSPRPIRVVGFKLTSRATTSAQTAAVTAQFEGGGVSAVIHNDLEEIRGGCRSRHPFNFYSALNAAPVRVHGVQALARELQEWMANTL